MARIRFTQGEQKTDPLFAAIPDRRSCKEPYDMTPLGEDQVARLADLAGIITDPDRVADLRDLAWQAHLVEVYTPRTMKESVDLMRIGKAEIEAAPDGIDLGGPFLETLALFGMLSREGQMDPASMDFRQGLDIYRELHSQTPAYAVIVSPGNSRLDQIEAGRRWLRLNLTTTRLGLSLHPVSQALQEYAEMKEHYDRVHDLLARPGETVQMLGRLGYGPATPQTPRWPLERRMV